jgi:hypothetical protein
MHDLQAVDDEAPAADEYFPASQAVQEGDPLIDE